MSYRIFVFTIFYCFIHFGCANKYAKPLESSWTPLLSDNSMSNFIALNGTAEYYVEDNTLIGISKSNTPNSFMCTRELYSDFILEFEVWADPDLNSGVQFRSNSKNEVMDGRVHGYQVEIESSPRQWAGGIYEEGGRGWLYPLDQNQNAKSAFKVNKWNHYRIEAIGDEIVTWVNHIQCAYLIDDLTATGFIGFQIHSIENENLSNKKVKWRNIRILTTQLEKAKWPISTSVPLINLTTDKS